MVVVRDREDGMVFGVFEIDEFIVCDFLAFLFEVEVGVDADDEVRRARRGW